MHPLILSILVLGCAAIVVTLPMAARRGKLHVPGYVGIAILAFAMSLLCGFASGYRSFAGTSVGVALSLLCFWLVATAVGSVLALCFYRQAAV
jgi:hypothetical protein